MQSQCGAGRRKSKKAGRKTRRRGGGYGVGEPISVGALEYVPNNTSNVGTARPGNNGGRRRKSKKAGRRKSKRGGGSVASVGYGYTGQGARGLADVTQYNANPIGPVTHA